MNLAFGLALAHLIDAKGQDTQSEVSLLVNLWQRLVDVTIKAIHTRRNNIMNIGNKGKL